MNITQIHKALLAISFFLCFSCGVNKEKNNINETYKVLNTLLEYQKTNYSSFTFVKDLVPFSLAEFENNLDGHLLVKNQSYKIPICADTLLMKKINFQANNGIGPIIWDSTKIKFSKKIRFISKDELAVGKFKNYNLNEILDSFIIEVSNPIFDKKKKNAIVVTQITREGKIAHYLTKIDGIWQVDCIYYINIQ